jgi:WD40 repeat protein
MDSEGQHVVVCQDIQKMEDFAEFRSLLRVQVIKFSDDGEYLATAANNYVTLWSMKTKEAVATTKIPTASDDAVRRIVFAVDCRVLLVRTNRYIWVWKPAVDQLRSFPNSYWNKHRFMACYPGRNLLAVAANNEVELREFVTTRRIKTYEWPLKGISCLVFAPDGMTMAAGGAGGIVIWDIDDL